MVANNEEIFRGVQEAFMEALGLEEDEVERDQLIFDDLGAESLDLLEIVFLLERTFKIKIPRDGIKEASQKGIDPGDYEQDGVLTELALQQLRELMPEVDPEQIKPGLTANEIPGLFKVQTFVNIVRTLLEEKAKG